MWPMSGYPNILKKGMKMVYLSVAWLLVLVFGHSLWMLALVSQPKFMSCLPIFFTRFVNFYVPVVPSSTVSNLVM